MRTNFFFLLIWRGCSLAALWFGTTVNGWAFQSDPEQELGTTATWEEIRSGQAYALPKSDENKRQIEVFENPEVLEVSPAGFSSPLLRDRFVLPPHRLLPGNGAVFLMRAVSQLSTVPPEAIRAFEALQENLEENQIPRAHEIRSRLEPFASVFNELERFVQYRDMDWDLHLNDLTILEGFNQTLYEHQQLRQFSRLLCFRVQLHLQEGNFAAAINDLKIGFRLIEFCRRSELLLVQLIGLAIEGNVHRCIEQAIRTPGCPNLYFALSEISNDPSGLRNAIDGEMSVLSRKLPIFIDVENEVWSEEQSREKWVQSLQILQPLTQNSNQLFSAGQIPIVVSLRGPELKQRLLEQRVPEKRLAELSSYQLLAWGTELDLQEIGDLATAALLVSPARSAELSERSDKLLKELKQKGMPAGYFGDMILPAVQVTESFYRNVARRRQLMTIEALRYYAHHHEGRLPRSLSDITELDLPVNPFTGETLLYSVSQVDGQEQGVLDLQVYPRLENYRILTLSIRSPKDNNQ